MIAALLSHIPRSAIGTTVPALARKTGHTLPDVRRELLADARVCVAPDGRVTLRRQAEPSVHLERMLYGLVMRSPVPLTAGDAARTLSADTWQVEKALDRLWDKRMIDSEIQRTSWIDGVGTQVYMQPTADGPR